jgi:hypothetical protein
MTFDERKIMKKAAVLLIVFCASNVAPAKPPGEITYAVNKDGDGYTFYQDDRRLAYSRAGDDGGKTQVLLACVSDTVKNQWAILTVTATEAKWLRAYWRIEPHSRPFATERDAVIRVLRQKPDRNLAGKRFPLPAIVAKVERPPVNVGSLRDIELKYSANKVGGYAFTHNGTVILWTEPLNASRTDQLVYERRPSDDPNGEPINTVIATVSPTEVTWEPECPDAVRALIERHAILKVLRRPRENAESIEQLLTK